MNHLERPHVLWLNLVLLIYCIYYIKNKYYLSRYELTLSTEKKSGSTSISFFAVPYIHTFLKFIVPVLIIIALAGPGNRTEFLPDEKNGIDMMIAMDVSGSMVRSSDFLPRNRLEVSKDLIGDFVKRRINDRLGLVLFAGAAYLQSPLTGDMDSLSEIINDVHEGSIVEQGTAIGDAILLSTYRLKKSRAKSRVILLLTDGVSNVGKIDTDTAAEAAKEFKVKIYTIGIGREFGESGLVDVDFEGLEKISKLTGGVFYRATDPDQLEKVLGDIDTLEKTFVTTKPKVVLESKFDIFLIIALILFSIDILLRAFVWKFYP
jgi:Ca-activated chloride channel family protein